MPAPPAARRAAGAVGQTRGRDDGGCVAVGN
jgi:hypothetical protein